MVFQILTLHGNVRNAGLRGYFFGSYLITKSARNAVDFSDASEHKIRAATF